MTTTTQTTSKLPGAAGRRFPVYLLHAGLALLLLVAVEARAQSSKLLDLLAADAAKRTSGPRITPEGQKHFDDLVAAANMSDTNKTETLAKSFLEGPWTTEPQQQSFARTLLDISRTRDGQLVSAERTGLDSQQQTLRQRKQELTTSLDQLKSRSQTLSTEETALSEKVRKGDDAGRKILGFLGDLTLSPELRALKEQLPDNRKKLEATRRERQTVDVDIGTKQAELNRTEGELVKLAADLDSLVRNLGAKFRSTIVESVGKLNTDGYPQLAQALANHYLRVVGADTGIAAAAQLAARLITKQVRARELAATIRDQVIQLIDDKKPWKALHELSENAKAIGDSAEGDEELLTLIARELGVLQRRANTLITEYSAERDGLFQRADLNSKVVEEFRDWLSRHPDYPPKTAQDDLSKLVRLNLNKDLEAVANIAKARPLEAYKKTRTILDGMDARMKSDLEAQLLGILDTYAANGFSVLNTRWVDKVTLALKNAMTQNEEQRRILAEEIEREAKSIQLEATAWLENPLDGVSKARFQSLLGDANDALNKTIPQLVRGAGLSFKWLEKMGTPILVIGGVLLGWFLFGRRRPPGA